LNKKEGRKGGREGGREGKGGRERERKRRGEKGKEGGREKGRAGGRAILLGRTFPKRGCGNSICATSFAGTFRLGNLEWNENGATYRQKDAKMGPF
jgi:hypothetical protein